MYMRVFPVIASLRSPGSSFCRVQAGAAYVKLAEWLETALGAKDRHLQNAAQAGH